MPQASSIKIAVLANLYFQAQQGKLKLTEEYVVRKEDLVPGSDILLGLTPGVTRLTLRDLATMMVAVSDNSATNVLIRRVGMDNVNAMLDSLEAPDRVAELAALCRVVSRESQDARGRAHRLGGGENRGRRRYLVN
jgi:beta-lactamase class A